MKYKNNNKNATRGTIISGRDPTRVSDRAFFNILTAISSALPSRIEVVRWNLSFSDELEYTARRCSTVGYSMPSGLLLLFVSPRLIIVNSATDCLKTKRS